MTSYTRTRLALLAALALALVACRAATTASAPAASKPAAGDAEGSILERLDVYRAEGVTAERIREVAGDAIVRFDRAIAAGDAAAAGAAAQEISPAIRSLGDFAFVDVARIQYYDPARTFVTIDLVERRDAAERMRFREEPTGTFDDPGGLLAAWAEYERIGAELLRSGDVKWPLPQTRAFHQLWGFQHPKLAPYFETFERGVAEHQRELERILRDDRDPEKRGKAAYLLAHVARPEDLTAAMVPAIDDPSSFVRNNAMRVLADASQHHDELEIPLDAIVKAMDYPATTDRNKSTAILAGLAKRPALREEIARRAGPRLIALLKLRQPNNHDWAYEVLRAISGESFGDRDVAAWERWLATVRRA